MKDIKKILIWVIFWCFILLLTYLYTNKIILVKTNFENLNDLIYIIFFVICFYYLIIYCIRPTYFRLFKFINTLIWLVVIFVSQYLIVNSWPDWIFYWDIICVIGVILTIIWPTNLLVSKELKESKDSKNIEIIEA